MTERFGGGTGAGLDDSASSPPAPASSPSFFFFERRSFLSSTFSRPCLAGGGGAWPPSTRMFLACFNCQFGGRVGQRSHNTHFRETVHVAHVLRARVKSVWS